MSHEHDEFEGEYAPGLPGPLPAGEDMLWQGAPLWRRLAVTAFHVRVVAAYFLLLIAWAFLTGYGVESNKALTLTISWLVTGGLVAVGIFLLAAWATARNAIFTITTRRVIVQFGVVLRMTFNLPFKAIERASLKVGKGGSGDIVLTLTPDSSVNYVAMWPFVRPWRFEHAEPMLRCLPDVAKVAELLGDAMAAAAAVRAAEQAQAQAQFGRFDDEDEPVKPGPGSAEQSSKAASAASTSEPAAQAAPTAASSSGTVPSSVAPGPVNESSPDKSQPAA